VFRRKPTLSLENLWRKRSRRAEDPTNIVRARGRISAAWDFEHLVCARSLQREPPAVASRERITLMQDCHGKEGEVDAVDAKLWVDAHELVSRPVLHLEGSTDDLIEASLDHVQTSKLSSRRPRTEPIVTILEAPFDWMSRL
jgi:hypothetical protein